MDYNKVRNFVISYLNGLRVTYITLGLENTTSEVEKLVPGATFSELCNIIEGTPIGHGVTLFVLNNQKQLIGQRVYNASKIWIETIKEAGMVYGVPYKRLERSSDDSWLIYF